MSSELQAAPPGGASKQHQHADEGRLSLPTSLAGTGRTQPAVLLILPLSEGLEGGKKGR